MDSTTDKFRAEIAAFCKRHEISGTKFSQLATNDPAFWGKLSRGRVPTLDTYDKVRKWMRDFEASQ